MCSLTPVGETEDSYTIRDLAHALVQGVAHRGMENVGDVDQYCGQGPLGRGQRGRRVQSHRGTTEQVSFGELQITTVSPGQGPRG